MIRAVLTGGPGTGKTSVANGFAMLGHHIVREAARMLINGYNARSPHLLPDLSKENRSAFQKAIETKTKQDYMDNTHGFFDRSVLDDIAY